MADREAGSAIRLLFDLDSGLSPTVTLTDAAGTTQGTGTLTEVGTSGRYYGSVTPTASLVQGLWTATPSSGDAVDFIVDDNTLAPSLHEIRRNVARQVDRVVEGRVTVASDTAIIDDTLIGGEGDFQGLWMLLDSDDNEAGLYRRVISYNGSTLILSSAWGSDPVAGTRYFLTAIHPDELQRSIRNAYQTLAKNARLPVKASGLAMDDDGFVTIPLGWSHVTAVWTIDTTSDDAVLTEQALANWTLHPGRQLKVEGGTSDDTATLYGVRRGYPPVWEDSSSDLASEIVVAAATNGLHASRAGGTATDPDEHLRRSVMSLQALDTHVKRRGGRAHQNQREVLP